MASSQCVAARLETAAEPGWGIVRRMVQSNGVAIARDAGSLGTVGSQAPIKMWFLAWLAFVPVALGRAENFSDSDTFWQIRTGLLTLDGGKLPHSDPFSWTAGGEPWTLNSWGFNVVLAWLFDVGGLVAVALGCGLLAATIGGLVLLMSRKLGSSPVIAGWLLLFASPLMIPWLSARPHLVDFAAVLLLILLLRRILESPSPRHFVLLALLTVLWVNLHAAALVGVAIVGGSAALAAVKSTTRARAGWLAGALLVTLLASFANPYGVGIFSQTASVKDASTVIAEWQPLNVTNPVHMFMFAAGLAALIVASRRRDVVFSAALLVCVAGSLAAIRMLPLLLLVSLPVLSSAAGQPVVLGYVQSRRKMFARCGTAAVAVIAGLAVVNFPAIGRPDPAVYPGRAIQAIPPGCRLFNDYMVGGLVILQRPDVLVSLDSRNDLYGAERVDTYMKFIAAGDGDLDKRLAGADCVLVPSSSGLAKRLHTDSGWNVVLSEDTAALFARVPRA